MHILQRGGEQQNTSFIFFLPEGGMKINIPLQGEGYKEREIVWPESNQSPTCVQPESNLGQTRVQAKFNLCT